MIRGICFDLDNTLYSYKIPHKKGLEAAMSVLSKHMSKRTFMTLRKRVKEELKHMVAGGMVHDKYMQFQLMLEMNGTPDLLLALKAGDAYWKAFFSELKPDAKLGKMLSSLKKKYRLGIASNLYPQIQMMKLKKLEITKYINTMATSAEIEKEKPSELVFLLAAHKMGLMPEEILFVGDDPEDDVEGAKMAGMKVAIVGKKKGEADYRLNTIYELESLVETLA